MTDNTEISLSFGTEDVNLILEALGGMPFVKVHHLVGDIQRQAQPQLRPDIPDAEPSAEPSADFEEGGNEVGDDIETINSAERKEGWV